MNAAELLALGPALDVRDGSPAGDAIDGVPPALVVSPRTPEAVAATLAWADRSGAAVLVRGRGSKAEWGRPPRRVDVLLDLSGLQRVLAYEAGDLTVRVEAGLALAALNRLASAQGQRLPIDPPFAPEASVGGLLASNDSGPLRHRFGAPRDLVIGIQLALADGTIANAGGQVVKNVAGYDLSRLAAGSFGSLAVITSATFKLSPVPPDSATLRAAAEDASAMAEGASALGATQLEPVALDLSVLYGADAPGGTHALLVRFAAAREAVGAQVEDARRVLAATIGAPAVLSGLEEASAWRDHDAGLWGRPGAIAGLSWRPADVKPVLERLQHLAGHGGLELSGRAAVGAGLLRLDGSAEWQTGVLRALRADPLFGNVVIRRAPAALKAAVDVWPPPRAPHLLQAIKRALDPNDTLGAGRGPI